MTKTPLQKRAEAMVRHIPKEFTGDEINTIRSILFKALIVKGRITNAPLK
jgi:hypothetical protein